MRVRQGESMHRVWLHFICKHYKHHYTHIVNHFCLDYQPTNGLGVTVEVCSLLRKEVMGCP